MERSCLFHHRVFSEILVGEGGYSVLSRYRIRLILLLDLHVDVLMFQRIICGRKDRHSSRVRCWCCCQDSQAGPCVSYSRLGTNCWNTTIRFTTCKIEPTEVTRSWNRLCDYQGYGIASRVTEYNIVGVLLLSFDLETSMT